MELTPKQRLFADHYIKTGNAREAYKAVYTGVKNDATADAAASRLLSNVKVNAYITKVQGELQKKESVTVERIVNELVKEAFGVGINDVAEISQDGKLKLKPGADLEGIDGLSWNESLSDKGISKAIYIKKKDKLKALDQLCKVLGIGAYGKDGPEDPARIFESNAGRVLDAVKGLRGKKGS